MKTLLDKPLFKLLPDASPRQYANVSNLLEVVRGGRVTTAHIQVGASLFHLMHYLGVPVDAEVSLFLDQEGDRMIFGISVNEDQIHDLWSYSIKLLPPFLG